MQSKTIDIKQLFMDRRQYQVPFYQRAYVWNKSDQWKPLWLDIEEKAEIRLSGEKSPSRHFLGAIVLEPQRREGLIGVESQHIIDGQQRITTLQYVLNAIAIHLRSTDSAQLSFLVSSCIWNGNEETMDNPDVEKFKLFPTFKDRTDYIKAMNALSQDELRVEFPDHFTQAGTLRKQAIIHPPALSAIWFFCEQIAAWLDSYEGIHDRESLLNLLCSAVLSDLAVVCISLEEDDDAQVIFETLNGRGAELHATDLIRNFIFLRADRENADSKDLYDRLWLPFEGEFWGAKQTRGRISRPRLEWFVQSAIQAETADEVDIGRLYLAYRHYVLGDKVISAEQQLDTLSEYSSIYSELVTGKGDGLLAEFGRRMRHWDPSTSFSLVLAISRMDCPKGDLEKILDYLMSFFVRRAVCGLSSKNYTNVFLSLLKRIDGSSIDHNKFRVELSRYTSNASRWPTDEEFSAAWLGRRLFPGELDAKRVRSVFEQLENAMRSVRTEEARYSEGGDVDVDHILPQSWWSFWPLNDGSKVEYSEVDAARIAQLLGQELTERQASISEREVAKCTIGNLTLVHYGVNRSMQNHAFDVKREAFFQSSNLHINRKLMVASTWDENAIKSRSEELLESAIDIWPAPLTNNG